MHLKQSLYIVKVIRYFIQITIAIITINNSYRARKRDNLEYNLEERSQKPMLKIKPENNEAKGIREKTSNIKKYNFIVLKII